MVIHQASGVAVIAGIVDTFAIGGVTISGSFNSVTHKSNAQKTVEKGSTGDTIAKIYSDVSEEEGTFEFVCAIKPFTPPTIGALGVLVDSDNTYYSGTNYIYEGYDIKKDNVGAMKVTFNVSRNTNITS